jgi:hypothetical protein
VAGALTACTAPTPTDSGAGVPASLTLTIGGARRFFNAVADESAAYKTVVLVLDWNSVIVPDARPTIVTRDARYVRLNSDGNIIPGTDPGSAYVVATLASPEGPVLADSVLVDLVCDLGAGFGLKITVTDSLTGNGGPFTNQAIVARSGVYVDSSFRATVPAQPRPSGAYLALEHAGTFDISVRADGYRTWTKSVTVSRNTCHVIQVAVAARLVLQ